MQSPHGFELLRKHRGYAKGGKDALLVKRAYPALPRDREAILRGWSRGSFDDLYVTGRGTMIPRFCLVFRPGKDALSGKLGRGLRGVL